MKINILDNDTILKIAAGEVIERPASVVRELVDNAIDAGSTSIQVEVEAGGREKIVVADNGEGMTAQELLLAVERHTTSKISNGLDLNEISTMGFRGEALASISAVSVTTITARTKDSSEGSLLVVRGGEKGEVQPASSPVGTRVEVSQLFFNTPARNKFMKRPATEFSAIAEIMHQFVLARPEIRFVLMHNGKRVMTSPGTGSLKDAIACIAGFDVAENLLPVNMTLDGYTVSGCIASPKHHRSNRAMQYFSVNRRAVQVRVMGSAIEKAFHTLLPINRYPIAFLDLELPPGEVDVNVHPAKREVKFSESNTVFRLVYQAGLQALEAITGSANTAAPTWTPKSQEPVQFKFPQEVRETPVFSSRPEGPEKVESFAPNPFQGSLERPEKEGGGGSWRPQSPPQQLFMDSVVNPTCLEQNILGQVFSSFIVVATPTDLKLVDQHAAQERVLYEKYLKMLKSGQSPSQVVIPIETVLPGRIQQFVSAYLPRLSELGFKIQLTDEGIIVKEVPILFKKMLSDQDIQEIIEELHQREGTDFDLSDYSQAALMLLACKGAVKANHKLSSGESRQLLRDLEECENSMTCPHGRPITVAFDRISLEKMFARR